jgi:hypothetical protein
MEQSSQLEENFNPQMASPSPRTMSAASSLQYDLDLDVTISEANTSTSLDTPPANRTFISLKKRMIAAKARKSLTSTDNPPTNDPINKYTKGEMPNVFYNHPTAALDFIDIDQIDDWENLPDGKLLAHPFGHEVRNSEAHQGIKARLFAAIVEITQSESVGICSPRPCPSATGTPLIFLVFNISELHRQMLLKREVWSSSMFTFRVTSLDPVCPDYLFGLTQLTTKSEDHVKDIVHKVWSAQGTTNTIQNIVDALPDDEKANAKSNLHDFIGSLRVKILETKKFGGAAAPTYNILANGKLINDDDTWCHLRDYLAAQIYAPPFQDAGITGTNLHRCSICQSVDHPRGLCTFPKIEGWNGPTWDIPGPDPRRAEDGRKYKPKRAHGLTYQ